jgi:hypothetical protein
LKFLLPKIVTKIHVPYRDMYTKYNKMIMWNAEHSWAGTVLFI